MKSLAKMKEINKLVLAAVGSLLLLLSISSTALAETCEIKEWNWNGNIGNFEQIEGETTCREGVFYIRQYWVSNDKVTFAGTATAIINGYLFTALFDTHSSQPRGRVKMRIKYDYKPSFFD